MGMMTAGLSWRDHDGRLVVIDGVKPPDGQQQDVDMADLAYLLRREHMAEIPAMANVDAVHADFKDHVLAALLAVNVIIGRTSGHR